MTNLNTITLNRMKMITWRWLKMNERAVEFPTEGVAGEPAVILPAGVTESNQSVDGVKCGCGPEVDALLESTGTRVFAVADNTTVEEPFKIRYDLTDGLSTFDKFGIVVGDHAKLTIIMDVVSEEASAGYHIIDDFGASVAENGTFRAYQIAFTGKENDLGAHVELVGDRSNCVIHSGYLTADDHVMDINYYVNHLGRSAESNIYTSGVLRDTCQKVFRTTIDFQPGAVKAVGEENENVLLMNDGCTNKTVPTILCGEEDVVGEHGCTVGRLADDLIFYLESRGIPNEEIYEMMAKARLEAIIRQIPDEKTREELIEFNNNL